MEDPPISSLEALRENRFREQDAGCAFTPEQEQRMHDDARAFTSKVLRKDMAPEDRLADAKRKAAIPRRLFMC